MKLNNDSGRDILRNSGIHLHISIHSIFKFAVQVVCCVKCWLCQRGLFFMETPSFFFISSPNITSGKSSDRLNLTGNQRWIVFFSFWRPFLSIFLTKYFFCFFIVLRSSSLLILPYRFIIDSLIPSMIMESESRRLESVEFKRRFNSSNVFPK